MAITFDRVREIFKGLENGDGAAFFSIVQEPETFFQDHVTAVNSMGPLSLRLVALTSDFLFGLPHSTDTYPF